MIGERRHISDYRNYGWKYCRIRYHLFCRLQNGRGEEISYGSYFLSQRSVTCTVAGGWIARMRLRLLRG